VVNQILHRNSKVGVNGKTFASLDLIKERQPHFEPLC
jgi:hypothetical protein